MKEPQEIEKMLIDLGQQWPADASIAKQVLEHLETELPQRPKTIWRSIMKSFLAIAVSLAVCFVLWWNIGGNHNTLYAQVMSAAHLAKTIHLTHHVFLQGNAQNPSKVMPLWETWYESGVGIRKNNALDWPDAKCDHTFYLGNQNGTWKQDANRKKTLLHSVSRDFTQEVDQMFSHIENAAAVLQNEGCRYPEGDDTFDGVPCKAYLLRNGKPTSLRLIKERTNLRQIFYLDAQSRLIRIVTQEYNDEHWAMTQFNTISYDEPLGSEFFQPNFGKDYTIVEAGEKPAPSETVVPQGPTLIYEVVSNSPMDLDPLVNTMNLRLAGQASKLAVAKSLADGRIAVTLIRDNVEECQRVKRQLIRPGTLEFRILADRKMNPEIVGRALNDPASEVLDASGKRLAWWVPVTSSQESHCSWPEIVKRSNGDSNFPKTEVLVVSDPYNITGDYLQEAKLQYDRREKPFVGITLNDAGGNLFTSLTGDHLPDPSSKHLYYLGIIIDGELFSVPSVMSRLGTKGMISGFCDEAEVSDLTAALNAGQLPAVLRLVEERPK